MLWRLELVECLLGWHSLRFGLRWVFSFLLVSSMLSVSMSISSFGLVGSSSSLISGSMSSSKS